MRLFASGISIIEHSSATRRSHSSGFSSFLLNSIEAGSISRSRWIVFASIPDVSARRFAARPVGAQSAMRTPFARRIVRIAFTIVVFPTPGPPVITITLEVSAEATAVHWLSASVSPSFFSAQGTAFSGSIAGHGGSVRESEISRSPILFSER